MTAEEIISRLREREHPPLRPTKIWDAGLNRDIRKIQDPALRSALHLWNDDLDQAHEMAQDLHTPLGSWLHGTMHRREGDYSNAKYWFRRMGDYPIAAELEPEWSASGMVDRCESASPSSKPSLLRLQRRELEALAMHCLALTIA